MADKDDKKAKKPEKPARQPSAEQAVKAGEGRQEGGKAGASADKAAADGKAGKRRGAARGRSRACRRGCRCSSTRRSAASLPSSSATRTASRCRRLDKIVINMGIGEGVADRKKVDGAAADLALIAGQKAVITKARKSIATYKLRAGQAIGCKVTLRKARMYEFLDRLINIALPRVRDFRGLNPKSFDGRGNYSLGIKEHIVFPEIDYDKAADIWGMDITVCTTARNDDEARALLTAFNFPFRQ